MVLAVALALAANAWLQSRAEREQARSALASVVEELKTNRSAVQESLDYHSGLLEMISRLQQESSAGEILYEEMFRAGVGGVLENYANLATIISTFSYREKQLVEFYDQTLSTLGASPPAGE